MGSTKEKKKPKSAQPKQHHHYLIEYDNAQLVPLREFFKA